MSYKNVSRSLPKTTIVSEYYISLSWKSGLVFQIFLLENSLKFLNNILLVDEVQISAWITKILCPRIGLF